MLFVAFVGWWYGEGWANTLRRSKYYLLSLSQNFSVLILLKTLFAPWKQLDAFGHPNMSLSDKFRQSIDRFVSRFVGFMVRGVTLFSAVVSILLLLAARAIWIVLWPCLPIMVPVAMLYGLGVIG
jgi:hypothetical protein